MLTDEKDLARAKFMGHDPEQVVPFTGSDNCFGVDEMSRAFGSSSIPAIKARLSQIDRIIVWLNDALIDRMIAMQKEIDELKARIPPC